MREYSELPIAHYSPRDYSSLQPREDSHVALHKETHIRS